MKAKKHEKKSAVAEYIDKLDGLPSIILTGEEVEACVKLQLDIPDERLFKCAVKDARKEITDEALFEWWLRTGLIETVNQRRKKWHEELITKFVADWEDTGKLRVLLRRLINKLDPPAER